MGKTLIEGKKVSLTTNQFIIIRRKYMRGKMCRDL